MKVVLSRTPYALIDKLDEEVKRYIFPPPFLVQKNTQREYGCSAYNFCRRHIEGMGGAAQMSRVAQSIQPNGVSMARPYLIEDP